MTGPASRAPERAAASGGRLVLVVDDDDSMREAVARLLGAAGFESRAYASAEALLADGVDGAACVVSDLRLPAMSGLDLLAGLRGRGERAPLILITAHDRPGLREEALKAGAVAYFVKPFRGTELLNAVRAAIEPAKAS